MSQIAFIKATALPETLVANALYFITAANGQLMDLHMSNAAGTATRRLVNESDISSAIAAYDLVGASKLAEAFTLAVTGAATGTVDIDGSGNVQLTLALADSGVTAGEYAVVTVDAKGIVTGGRALVRADLPAEIDADTTGNAATADRAVSAETADKTQAALTINGEAFDGSAAKSFDLVKTADVGVSVASLVNGQVPASQLPGFVDDVLEAADFESLPGEGEAGKLYVTLDDSAVYRWSGSTYVKVSDAVSTADTADTLATARQIGVSGDATGSVSFNGSDDAIANITLKDVGTAGEQAAVVTTDAAGRVLSSRPLTLADLPEGITSSGVALSGEAAW